MKTPWVETGHGVTTKYHHDILRHSLAQLTDKAECALNSALEEEVSDIKPKRQAQGTR